MKLALTLTAFVAFITGCAQTQKPVTVHNTATFASSQDQTEPVETIVIVTDTTIADANCQDILYFYRTLPIQETLSRPELLKQVADCNR